ncbi:MAG: right-handed parallel beta-helix repeat-containing protein [Lachnospiraceae bacterium]|nr:right-handed parallel beta-helix repeat-containing protein [Lachnospiraceae bacterium]
MKKRILVTCVSLFVASTFLTGCIGPHTVFEKIRRAFHKDYDEYVEFEDEYEYGFEEEPEEIIVEEPDDDIEVITPPQVEKSGIPKAEITKTPAPEEVVMNDVYVSDAKSFVKAIKSNTVIHLEPGVYNITDVLDDPTLSFEVVENLTEPYVGSLEEFDGLELEIVNIRNLTIVCDDMKDSAHLQAEPRYADVLHFAKCDNITISNVIAGHTPDKGSCAGDVLGFEKCRNIDLLGLDLYGCGTYGISAQDTNNLYCKNTKIRDCSYGLLDFRISKNAVFDDCTFVIDEGFSQIECYASQMTFNGCVFLDEADKTDFIYATTDSIITFKDCRFDDDLKAQVKAAQGKNVLVIN